jgi:hypothetical protein
MGKGRFFMFFLLIPALYMAQRSVFSIKPSLGFTACQVHGDSYSGFNKLGLMGGVYINAALKEKTSLEFGIIFIQKGAKHNQNPEKFDYRYYYLNLNYVEVPLILRYQPKSRFFLTVGASAGYLISYYEGNESGNITGYSPFKSFEYSVNAGLGIQINPKWSFEMRSNNSFVTIRPWGVTSNVFYNNFIGQTFNKGLYNNIIEVFLSYKITPKPKSAKTIQP